MAYIGEKPVMQGWELTALFLVFLFITLFWDLLVGLLTFLNNILRGRRANWLARVKEELLALGVVSLVLLFLEPSLQQICIPYHKGQSANENSPPSPPPAPVAYGTYSCNVGYRQVFPRSVIHAAHYLLFYLAIVHILFSLLTSVITNVKLSKWSVLERTARKEQNIPAVAYLRISSVIQRANDPTNRRLFLRLRETWRDAYGFVDQDLYSLLRFMCEKRFRAHSVVLRNFNFLNMCEQCLEAELNEVYSHAWLLVFMMALLLLYNRVVYQIVWISCLCLFAMALMSGNLRWVMKKTAREARNLWRKIQGMGGLEHDDDGDETEISDVASPNAPPPPYGAHPAALAAMAGVGGDLEAGDVNAQARMDQLQLMRVGEAHRMSIKRPTRKLRFAAAPIGEAVEQLTDCAAAACLPGGAASGGEELTCWSASTERQLGDAAGAPHPQPLRRPRTLLDMVETCRAARGGAAGSLRRPPGPPRVSSQPTRPIETSWSELGTARARECGVLPPSLFRRQPRLPPPPPPQRPLAGARSSAGCSQRGTWRYGRRPAAGPVAEGTISNPLYSPADGGTVRGLMYGSQLAVPQMYVSGAWGAYGTADAAALQYGMMGGVRLEAAAAGSSGIHMAAATAAAPYGGVGGGGTAPAVGGEGGPWGSNPSSGSPEGDESASIGSGTGSSVIGDPQSRAPDGQSKNEQEQGEEDDDEMHSEKSMFEHELASGIEEKITRLFFFGRPFLLLWLFNIIFAQASLTMTMSMAFVIPYDKFDSIRDSALPLYIWLPVVLTNLMLVTYGAWVFLPQYALLSVCGILEPHEVMEEIKRSKTADDAEDGIAGIVLEKMTHYFVGHHDGETRLSTAFIVTLASQAGIILGRDYKAQKHINKVALKSMYKEFMMVWHDVAWYGELTKTYRIKTDVPAFKEAFDELDEDGSGALSFGELANMIRSLGTYATAGDVEAMLWEIDIDNSHSIGFDEFVKFLVYAFFDVKQLGYIDTPGIMDAMERLGMPINDMQASVLMSVGNCEPSEEVKVTLRQFFGMFEKVAFEDEEEEDEGTDAPSGKTKFLARARDILRTPSMLFVGRFGSGSVRKQDSGSLSVQKSGLSGTSAATTVAAGGSISGGMVTSLVGADAIRAKQPSRLAIVSKP